MPPLSASGTELTKVLFIFFSIVAFANISYGLVSAHLRIFSN